MSSATDSSFSAGSYVCVDITDNGDPQAPNQRSTQVQRDNKIDEYKVHITGISGRFPQCNNMDDFFMSLVNGDDLITEDSSRWRPGLYGLPKRHGKLLNLDAFDANAFGVAPKQGHAMDPQLRKLLEVTFEAILDSAELVEKHITIRSIPGLNQCQKRQTCDGSIVSIGHDPDELRGSNTGVFIGASESESVAAQTQDPYKIKGYSLIGGARAMFANRISYTFDFNGPSLAVDTACSSSLQALCLAFDSLKLGRCSKAIVAGVGLVLSPNAALQFKDIGLLSADGKCKSFDATGTGYVRSECVCAVLLEKMEKPYRTYCEVVNARSNADGYKTDGIIFPNGAAQQRLLEMTYKEVGVNPLNVSYIEAHGTGTMAGDPQEVNAIENVFCSATREQALLIGSVKSVMGHAEPASGMASIAKVVACMENNVLVPNLHYERPNPEIPSLFNGHIQVVTDVIHWGGGYAGINSFGFGGANAHVILKSGEAKCRTDDQHFLKYKRLIRICGRTEDAVKSAFDLATRHADNADYIALLDRVANQGGNFGRFRGFSLADQTSDCSELKIQCNDDNKQREVWFIFSGMGSQYEGMACDLMSFDVFRETIAQCDQVLQPLGINLSHLILSKSDLFTSSIVMAFVGLCCIQIALTNLLKKLNIHPDKIVGHSIGELCCAYADGCLSLSQVIHCAYWRGKCIQEARLPKGAMVAIGTSWDNAVANCPPGVEPACHNANDSVTISGRREAVLNHAEKLRNQGVFVKEVNTLGYAFHSSDMRTVAPRLVKYLKEVITSPKSISKKWISTSMMMHTKSAPQTAPFSETCSAEYIAHNLCSPVRFYEAIMNIPENAVVIEISPHCLMQAVMRRSLSSSSNIIGTCNRKATDQCSFTLDAIGRIYNYGININTSCLYKNVDFPVPKGTPMVAPLVRWDHSQRWYTAGAMSFSHAKKTVYCIDAGSDFAPDRYLTGHKIDGRALFPFTGYLDLTWRALARCLDVNHLETIVEFEDVVVHRPCVLASEILEFEVSVMTDKGRFEVVCGGDVFCTGKVRFVESNESVGQTFGYLKNEKEFCSRCGDLNLTSKEIYSEFRVSGFDYENDFRAIDSSCNCGAVACIRWNDNYVTFIDGMLQTVILASPDCGIPQLLTRLRFARIDPTLHNASVIDSDDVRLVKLRSSRNSRGMVAGGIEVAGFVTVPDDRRNRFARPILEKIKFTQFNEANCLSGDPSDAAHIKEYSNSVKECHRGTGCDHQVESKCPHRHVIGCKRTKSDISSELRSDCLFRRAWSSTALMALGGIALENTLANRLNCCAIDAVDMDLVKQAKTMLELSPLVQTTWTMVNGLTHNMERARFRFNIEEQQFVSNMTSWNDVFADDDKFHICLADYVISSHSSQLEYLQQLSKKLHDGGFILASEQIRPIRSDINCAKVMSIEEWKDIFAAAGLRAVAYQTDSSLHTCLFLLRKVTVNTVEIASCFDIDMYEDFSFIDELKIKMVEAAQRENGRVHVLTRNPFSGIFGFIQCLRAEGGNHQPVRAILLETEEYKENDFNDVIRNDLSLNCYRNGTWGTWRHFLIKDDDCVASMTNEAIVLSCQNRGDLSSLRWYYDHSVTVSDDDSTLCSIEYASVNFRDVMLASGRLAPAHIPGFTADQHNILGLEFSGRNIATGDRVMGIAAYGCIATHVNALTEGVWTIPDNWTSEQAASVPVAYMTSYYALIIRGKMSTGDTVLIHSGSGGVGQAAITIALSRGAVVLTTVGVDEKKRFLEKAFGHHRNFMIIGSTRNCMFEQAVMENTNGRGVDIVLNSLSDDKFQASVRCLAVHGRFCEIGKYDMSQNSSLGMSIFMRNIDFYGILVDRLDKNNRDLGKMRRLFTEGLSSGEVVPLNTHVFGSEQVSDAFRFMAHGKHIGKVMIKVDCENIHSSQPKIVSFRHTFFEPNDVYLITGGLGGVGLRLAHWIAEGGGRKLILTSRNGLKNGTQKRGVRKLEELGVKVLITKLNVARSNECEELLKLCKAHGNIGGVFHLAMVLRDSLFEDQCADNFVEASSTKIAGTRNLDVFTRKLCKVGPKYFVAFSSVAAGRGNKGQTSYAWANSAMERIIANRKRDGLSGIAIQWGAIGDVGIVMEIFQSNNANVGGTLPQRIKSVFRVMDRMLQMDEAIVSSFVRAPTESPGSLRKSADFLTNIANVLGVDDVESLNLHTPLGELGLDSLMGAEVRKILGQYDIMLPMKKIKTITIDQIRELIDGASIAKDDSGLVASDTKLFSVRINPNELMRTDAIVKINKISSGINLFVVHSIEGISTTVEEVAGLIHSPVYCFQQTPDVPVDSITSVAQYYIQKMRTIQPEGPYSLAGYSYGGAVVYEMSKCLTNNGEVVRHLIFLESSYIVASYYKAMFRATNSTIKSLRDDPLFEVGVLCFNMKVFSEFDSNSMEEKLFAMSDWSERVKYVASLLVEKSIFAEEHVAIFCCEALRDKILVGDDYDPDKDLQKMDVDVHLIKADNGVLDPEIFGNDLSLSKAFSKPISINTVKGDHDSFIHDEGAVEVAQIIDMILAT